MKPIFNKFWINQQVYSRWRGLYVSAEIFVLLHPSSILLSSECTVTALLNHLEWDAVMLGISEYTSVMSYEYIWHQA